MNRQPPAYNYPRFKAEYYRIDGFAGPHAGEDFPAWRWVDAEGAPIDLEQYRGKWVVIETGSITCPQYIANIDRMKALQKKFPEAVFLLLYVREAHPGPKISAHESMEAKTKTAQSTAGYGEERKILVDTVEGDCHLAIGGRPNMVYVLNPDLKVVFRSDWNVPELIEKILSQNDPEAIDQRERFEPKLAPPILALKVVGRAGLPALWDLFLGLPELVRQHYTTKTS